MKHETEKPCNYGAQVNAFRNHKVGSSTPCCPPAWPAPFGRSPEDADNAARARSGALGYKASGANCGGRQFGDHRYDTPHLIAAPPRLEAACEGGGAEGRTAGGRAGAVVREQRRERPAGGCGGVRPQRVSGSRELIQTKTRQPEHNSIRKQGTEIKQGKIKAGKKSRN